ncbi:MAG TPA: recombinase family protein [Clostridiaceae bacterium]
MYKRGAIYARFSSENQRDESIDAQVRAIEEYASKNDIKIVKVYADKAKSATSVEKRSEFLKMIKESAMDIFDTVIVHKLDRFSRDKYDSATYKRKLKQNGIRLISVVEHLDGSPESVILESVIEGMAEYFSKNLAREVKKGLRETALQCKHTGGMPPFGYDVDDNKSYKVNHKEAEAVRMIYEMYVNGHGYSDIIEKLNNMGVRTKADNTFAKNSLSSILRNEKYSGTYVFNRSAEKDGYGRRNNHKSKSNEDIIRIPGGIPQIVDQETFDKVQETLAKRKRAPGANKARVQYLLSGLIRCGECGFSMQGNRRKQSNKPAYISYRCSCRKQKHECTNTEIRREYVEEFVLSELEKHILNEKAIPGIVTKVNEYVSQKRHSQSNRLEILKEELKNVNKEVENIIAAIISGFSQDIMKSKLNDLEAKKKGVEIEIAEMEVDHGTEDQVTEEQVRMMFLNLKEYVKTRNIPECKKLIDDYVKEVIVYRNHVEVIFNVVFSFVGNGTRYEKKVKVTRNDIRRFLRKTA